MKCKFCHELQSDLLDLYLCEECESYVCHNCVYTSIKTGKDYCEYCKRNLQYEGRKL